MTQPLHELPEPAISSDSSDIITSWPDLFTADQMRAYARTAIEHAKAKESEDAARYQWIREFKAFRNPEFEGFWGFFNSGHALKGGTLDAAIDAARTPTGEQHHE